MRDNKTNSDGKKVLPDELNYNELDGGDKALVDRAVRKGYSRREALKLMVATGVTMATADSLFSPGSVAMAQTPKKGGNPRAAVSLHGPDDKLDPILFTSAIDYTRGRAHYNSLTQLDDDMVPQPELAETFEPNSTATEWTLKLRKDVTWHDGSAFSADDVVWSMNRHLGEDSVSVIKAVLGSVKEWKKVGSHEVKAVMNTPNSDLPTLLGIFQSKIVKDGTDGGGMGTGPFVMENFEPGVKSLSVRNENYWREPAHLDSVEITAITDPIARVNALISGDFHMISDVDPKAIRQIDDADGVSMISIPAGAYNGLCAMQNTEHGSNADFVKGLQFAQDRERIVKKILKGHGSVGNDQPIMSAYGADFCNELAVREFDLDKAKYHFEKSGISSAEIFVAPVGAGIEDTCLLAQANCAKAGFDLKIKKVPNDGYWGAVWMKEPLNVTSWNMRPTANSMLSIAFAPDAPWNDTLWKNDRVGELLKLALAEIDPDKRHDMYCEIQTLVNTESGMVIPAHLNVLDGISHRVGGMPKNPLGVLGASEFPEYVWINS